MKRLLWFCFVVAIAAAGTGTPTRPSPSDYDAHQTLRGAVLAATLLTPAQTEKVFPRSVGRNFDVVEIAIYPENGQTFDLLTLDFALRTGRDQTNFAATPQEVAWYGKQRPRLSQPNVSSRGVNVTTAVGVGIGTRTDPATGKTVHGVSTWEGVQVDNAPRPMQSPAPSHSADDAYALESKLRALELEERQFTQPLSGYLYFPAAKGKKNGTLVLEYSKNGERATLKLPVR